MWTQACRTSVQKKQAWPCKSRRIAGLPQCACSFDLQVWRPLSRKVEESPLGFIDAATVSPKDLNVHRIEFPGRTGFNYAVSPNPNHRWVSLRVRPNCSRRQRSAQFLSRPTHEQNRDMRRLIRNSNCYCRAAVNHDCLRHTYCRCVADDVLDPAQAWMLDVLHLPSRLHSSWQLSCPPAMS